MAHGLFITGTDTEVGKTFAATGLIHALRERQLKVAPMKPIASGCVATPAGLRNEDAEALIAAAGGGFAYEIVNPFAYAPAIAPHFAAADAYRPIVLSEIEQAYRQLAGSADIVVVEGAGGWRVPLGEVGMMSDIPRRLQLPVVLVVGVRLGCLNHAMLTAEAIQADGCRLFGWIANLIDGEDDRTQQQIDTLRQRLPAPLLGVLPRLAAQDPAAIATHLLGESLDQALQAI